MTLSVQNVVCECVVALTRGASDMQLASACYAVQALWMDAEDMMQEMGFLSYFWASANLVNIEDVLDAMRR